MENCSKKIWTVQWKKTLSWRTDVGLHYLDCIIDAWQNSKHSSGSEYVRDLNTPRLHKLLKSLFIIDIWQSFECAYNSDIPGLQRVLCKLYSRDSLYSEYASISQYTKVFNISGVLICYGFKRYIDRVINISVLNIPEFWTYQGCQYVIKVRQGFEYIWLSHVWISPK